MIYAIARAVAASLSLGLSAQLPGVGVLALALLWSSVAVLVAPASVALAFAPLFFELSFGVWLGLVASVPIVAARLGSSFGDDKLAAPFGALGVLFAGAVLFAAKLDHALLRAFAESFVSTPAGQAHAALKGPDSFVLVLELTLTFSLRVGSTAIVALLLVDLANSLMARLFPGQVLVQLPREPVKAFGLYLSLGAIAYVIIQAAEQMLDLTRS